ncbi:GyrI-like domain-containing protein [Clostridium brassicae]|uniref:GyrI-like domain-containing protein n=1 Tax=Clostridium brassicae TaxID=2999072 RepID=A0ABT4DFD4_9CLOT|nr:GyrI-like domain-containing protein [Clostridium brassicae]MCY6959916.1 GyrI-like domain-containing protein [Clostridium brassicae]
MNYEIVELNEKTVVGITTRTSNTDRNMTKLIGGLWYKFFNNGIYESISNKKNNCSIGLYSNYENNENGLYDVTVCCEVSTCENLPVDVQVKKIPAGKYAKFVVNGHVQTAVSEFWTKLWSMDLNRKYSCDFEEYQSDGDMENCEIHMYISIN